MAGLFNENNDPYNVRRLTGTDVGLQTPNYRLEAGDYVSPLSIGDIERRSEAMKPQEIQLAGFDPVMVTAEQYKLITDRLSTIADKNEMEQEEIRIASALSYSRNFGLDYTFAYNNLDQLAMAWNGIKYTPTATNMKAIVNSFKVGQLNNRRGRIGTQMMNIDPNDPAFTAMLNEAASLSTEMEGMQDDVPRPWYVKAMTWLMGNLPYFGTGVMGTAEGAAAGRLAVEGAARLGGMTVTNAPLAQLGQISLQATKIGGKFLSKFNLPVASVITAISILDGFAKGKEIDQGNIFLDLINDGIPYEIAKNVADATSSVNQAIEYIGGLEPSYLKAFGLDIDTFASRVLSRMYTKGRFAEVGHFLASEVISGVEEGSEDFFQTFTTELGTDFAFALSGIDRPEDPNAEPTIVEAGKAFGQSFVVSLMLGLPANVRNTRAGFNTVRSLRDLSLNVRSKESYDELAAAMRPEDINEADWKTVTDTQFERGKQEGFNAFRETISQQDLDTTLVDLDPDAEVQSDDEVTGDGQQKVTVDRLSNGKLYGHESRTRWRLPGSFGSGHTFNYGSPETRKSYGAINYTTDSDGHLTITNVRTRAGYENLRQEMVSDFISRFPDMDITWETNSVEEESIRTNLINSNPRGTDYGLNYGRGTNAADIQNVRTRIGTLFSEDEATNSALAEIVEMVADREGITGSEWLDRHIPEFRKWTAEEQAEADAGLPEGYHRTGASEFYDLVDGVKAVVYAGEYANPTTFLHEMTHVLRRIGENGNEFRTLFNKVRNDADFQSFVNNSRSIKHKDLSTLFNTDEWTADDDEFFAELGEAYWMSGQTMNNELSGFFSRLTRMFRQIYRALRGTGKLNDEVVSYYDRLYGAGTAENRETPTAAPTTEEAVTNASDSSVASEGTEIADAATSVDGTATPTADELRKGANEALDDSSDPVVTAEQDPDPAATYTMNASYAVSEWNAAMFRDAFRQKVSNEAVRSILDSIPIALHRAAGLVRISAGSSITPNDQYTLSPRYENMTEEDAAKMQRNADEYAAAVQKHDERQRGIIADGTVALDYTVNGKTYHMDSAAVDGLGMFTPVEYIEEAGLQDNPVRLSINADNVRVEGLEQPDPNVLWKDIPDRTPIMEEEEFADEYDPYESGLDEDGNPLYQTIDDITATGEWQETEVRLRANAANFDEAGRPLAPNGQLSKLSYREWVTVRTPSFMAWFGDWMNDPENASKIIDDNGEPLVVYHGTASEFSVFDRNYLGSSTEAKSARIGFFFTNNQRTAEGYGNYASGNEARQLYKRVLELEKQGRWEEANQLELRVEELALQKSNGIVMPAFLNIRNPYVVDADGASFKETGKIFSEFEPDKYDGMTVYSLNDNIDDDYVADHYIALRPNQIKSINNRGTFDSGSPDIYYQTTDGYPRDYRDGRRIIRMTPSERELYMQDRDRFYRELEEWTEGTEERPLTFQKGADRVSLVTRNMREDSEENPWSASNFVLQNGSYEPSSHSTFATKYDAVRTLAEERFSYVPEGQLMFQTADGETALNKDLFVTHTLSENKLQGAIAIGGFVMPSLGITRTNPELVKSLTGFGTITLIGSNRLGNQLVREGVVYNRDMWSPVFPHPEYTPNKRKLDAFISRLNKYAISDRRLLSSVDAYSEYQYADPDDFAARLDGDNAHMAYAAEKGIPYETVYTHMPTDSYTSDFIVKAKAWLDENRERLNTTGYDTAFEDDMWNALRPYMEESFRERFGEDFTQRELARANGETPSLFSKLDPAKTAERNSREIWDKVLLDENLGYRRKDMYSLMRLAESYDPDALIVDEKNTMQNLRQALEGHDVRAWVREQISDAYSEPFLRIGRQKYPVTAENILRYMMKQNLTGNSGFIGTLSSAASNSARSLNTIQALHDAESLLGLKGEGLDDEYMALVRQYLDIDNSFEAMDGMVDIIGSYLKKTSSLNKPVMRRLIMNDQWLVKRTNESADAFADFAEKLRNETRPYFEAKPKRIMQLSDFMAAVVDDNVSQEARKILSEAGLDVIESTHDGRAKAVTDYVTAHGDDYLFQTMTDEAQDAYVEAAQTFAIENHEALFQTMDFGDSEELRGYFAQMIKEAANYTDYDEFHAVAEWIYPDDEMVERAWRVAKNPDEGSDNTGAMPKKTLARPDLSASSEDAKDAEFIEIISTDEGFNEWLNAIMQACRDVDSENTRAVYEAVDREEVAPLIRNLVFPRRRWVGVRRGGYDFAARDEKTHAKAIASAKGILRANPSFYRDLYARATETDFWISTYGDRIPQDIIDEAPEEFASLSASGRQKLAERIRNERLRRSILAGSEKYDPSQVRSLIKQQDDAIAAGQLEVKRLEDELNKLGRKYGDAQSARFRLWNQVTEKDAEISAAQQRLTDISNRIAAHSRRDFGDDGSVSQRLVDQQQKLASQISELVKQQNSYLRQLKNEAVSDAVREQYDKDLARMRDIRQKRDEKLQALRDRYRERDALRAVNRHKEELAEIIMREPSKNVDLEEADKIRAIQALLDPAFRRGMRVNGETWDIKTLKAMFRGETERDPVVFGALTEEQLTRLSKKDLNEWTLEELEEMATAVRALRKQGLQRRQMKVDAERARIQRYRDSAMSAIIGSGNYKEPPTPGSTEKREEDRSFLNRMRSIYYSTINWARKSQILDGTSNHNPDKSRMYNATIGRTTTGHKGVFYDLLVRMKRDAESEEFRMMTERMKPVRDYIKAHKINEDSFYEKFTIDIDGRKQTYRYSDLVYIYLSQNNPRNRDAVAYGEFVSQYEKDTIKRDVEDEIIGAGRKKNAARSEEINNRIREIGDARYESVLRQAESIIKDESRRDLFEVVRLIEADFNSGLFDRLRRAMAETYNIRVEKEAYYLPINRTDFAGSEPGEVLKQDLMNMIPDNGSVQRGFTKDRQDISPYWQKPINIDFFNVWQQSVYNQEHALSHIDYVRLLKGVFQNKGAETLQAVISSSYGQTMVQSIKDHINQIANPQSFTKKSGGDSLLRFLRGSLYSSYLGFKASSVVLQAITSPAPYLGAVNPLELAQGYFTVLKNPIQMWEEIQRLSPFMATRSYHPIIEWMKTEAQRGDLSKVRRTVMRIEDAGMTGLELVDRYAVAGGWWAIYTKERNRLLNEGNLQTEAEIEKAAAKVADEFVQETQPQSNITELSPMFQNRNEAWAAITQFQASLNVVWQNVTYDVPQAIKNGQYAKAIGMITGYVVAGALLYMVQQGFDDDDDNKEKMQKLLYGMTTQITSGVPLVSDLVDSTVEAAITGETSNFFSSSTFPAFDKLMKAMQNTAKQNYGKAMENLTDSMLLFTGFPYSGLKEAGRLFGIGDEDGKLGFYPGEIVGRRHE